MQQLHSLTLSELHVLKTVWISHSKREILHAKRPYAIQYCHLEYIPKGLTNCRGSAEYMNKVRETCWEVPPEDWVLETVVTVWLMQMIMSILLGMLFN